MNDKNDMQIFTNEKFGNIRTIIGEDGAPRFCLADVCKSPNLAPRVVTQRLTKDACSTCSLLIADNERFMIFVNVGRLYNAILESRWSETKTIKKLIFSEMLPLIRKHGTYMTSDNRKLTEKSL